MSDKKSAAALGLVMFLAANLSAAAADIAVVASNAVKSALEDIAPAFEKASGHKLIFTFGAAIPLQAGIEKGAPFDVAVLTGGGIDDLAKKGFTSAATRTAIANSGVGVAVKKGAAKPDISTVEAFKAALVAAKSIAYVEQGGSGVYLTALLPKLGLAEAMKGKVKLLVPENPAAHAVANGEVEIGMTQISEILPYAGAELVGPLPADIQLTTRFVAAVAANSGQAAGAAALLKFLTSPASAAVIKAKGLDPA